MIGVFFILFAAFGTWRLATLSFLTLPSALVGGVLAVYFFNDSILSLGSLVGFLTVFGIAARNKIMLIAHYQHLEKEEGMPFGPELILRGAMERLSPIMMTALATGLALVPLAIAGDIPGHEVEHPMAVVILGGLITSTLLNLFIVPVLYLHFGKSWNIRLAAPWRSARLRRHNPASGPHTACLRPGRIPRAFCFAPTRQRYCNTGINVEFREPFLPNESNRSSNCPDELHAQGEPTDSTIDEW